MQTANQKLRAIVKYLSERESSRVLRWIEQDVETQYRKRHVPLPEREDGPPSNSGGDSQITPCM